jgi:hypothetical protein
MSRIRDEQHSGQYYTYNEEQQVHTLHLVIRNECKAIACTIKYKMPKTVWLGNLRDKVDVIGGKVLSKCILEKWDVK